MAEAAVPKMDQKGAGVGAKPKRSIQLGKKVLQVKNPVQQQRLNQVMWDYNHGKKSAGYRRANGPRNQDNSDIPSFEISDLPSEMKSTASSDSGDDTIHDTVWKEQQQARRRHKNYKSPQSFSQFEADENAKGKLLPPKESFNDTDKENTIDVSIVSRSEIDRQMARRRRANYRSPVEFDQFLKEKDCMDKEEKDKALFRRRLTLAQLGNYSDVLKNAGNTTAQSSTDGDCNKTSEVARKDVEPKKNGNEKHQYSGILNDAGLEISAIADNTTGKKIGTRPSTASTLDEEEISENLKELRNASKIWQITKHSTPISAVKSTPATNSNKGAGAQQFPFDALAETKEDEALIEGAVPLEESALPDALAETMHEAPIEGAVPLEESALPEGAATLETSASAEDLTLVDRSVSPVAQAASRSAPPSPPARRYPMRNRKPTLICHVCKVHAAVDKKDNHHE